VPFLRSLEIYHDALPHSAAMHMALDEVLWQCTSTPCLRFYQWDHPAVSLGYFGCYTDIAQYERQWDLVRRCTGGGVVFHGNDLTYALIIPADGQQPEHSPMAIYGRVHEAIQRALRDLGIRATLVPNDNSRRFAQRAATRGNESNVGRVAHSATSTDACFANPVSYDVMIDDIKIAGAAQRRSRRGLLQQGSIQNVELPVEFRDRFVAELCGKPLISVMDTALVKQAESLAETKYGTGEWLRRR
jgi:lipoate-protein ligase A